MAVNHLKNITQEERMAAKQAAQEEKEYKIQEAIKNGAKVNYMTSNISYEYKETNINISYDGTCIIDTTIPKDITKYLKQNWKIVSVTYLEGTNTITGMIFEGSRSRVRM